MVADLQSVGIDLARYVDDGTLQVVAGRPTQIGLEHHLSGLHRTVEARSPSVVVIDNAKAVAWLNKGAQPTETVERPAPRWSKITMR